LCCTHDMQRRRGVALRAIHQPRSTAAEGMHLALITVIGGAM
jgi:hypothetical protein